MTKNLIIEARRAKHPARDAGYGRIAILADPFGHGFCLIEFSATGYNALITDAMTSSGAQSSET